MLKYFKESLAVTILGIIAAYFWGEHIHNGSGLLCVFIALILGILEVSLSFDNAVVNALKLEKMEHIWQHRFLTWGILIAVFGMRFLFPLLVVGIFAKLSIIKVAQIALTDSQQYAQYLHLIHAPIAAFGGAFLLMLFMNYFFNCEKNVHWIKGIEDCCSHLGNIKGFETIVTLIAILITQHFIATEFKASVMFSGIIGVITYLLIDGITHWLEKHEQKRALELAECAKGGGLVAFLYLELIDASFSLDGVLGAFALSQDILIITIGLSIGAMFVRSLTIMLVEKKTLDDYIYLEHGAHWAIGALAIIMFISTGIEVPEVITGLLGLGFILASLASSLLHNKKTIRK
ncbi:MAG: DUF475 domain-containing protein [Candidatus Gastranaerophilaceae bacterium]